MKRSSLAVLLSGILLLCLLTGCGAKTLQQDRTVFAMDTVMSLRVYAPEKDGTLDALEALLIDLDRELSATDPESKLSGLNGSGAVSDRALADLVRRSADLSRRTGGALDLSLLPASRLWGFPSKLYRVPDPEALEALRSRIGMDKVSVTEEEILLTDGAQLDLGAVAKGWAADRCREILEENGVSGILALGGNIQTVGKKPDGTDWRIGIQDPEDPAKNRLVLTLAGTHAVVTSGDYQRAFTENGVTYCHILDPQTLSPVQNSLRSVTVVADEGFLADGLSTALFVMGREAGVEFWRSSTDFEAVWIEADGTVTVTEGLSGAVNDADVTVVKR